MYFSDRIGNHTFLAKLANDPRTTVRNFTIVPTFTAEIEPNNSPFTATPLTSNGIMRGSTSAELDVDWFHVVLNRDITFNPSKKSGESWDWIWNRQSVDKSTGVRRESKCYLQSFYIKNAEITHIYLGS